uniref:Uncharacterized protein n=1 Tax=Triticum urartu TaxID=4572 RepID=A0A8R7K4G2_TRIUA
MSRFGYWSSESRHFRSSDSSVTRSKSMGQAFGGRERPCLRPGLDLLAGSRSARGDQAAQDVEQLPIRRLTHGLNLGTQSPKPAAV